MSGLATYVTGAIAIAALAVAWAGIQIAWRRTFPAAGADPDPLVGRLGCHGCADEADCERRKEERR